MLQSELIFFTQMYYRLDDDLHNDGFVLKPKSLHSWLTRVLYNRRSQFDPLWINAFVAGMQNGEP